MRATVAVFFSIPLSALATLIALQIGGSSINSMVLGGLALAFSRLIDNSVVVLENIYRHLELGEPPAVAAEKGGREVALPVLAATLTTVVVFFPVTLLYGVSKFLFSALALAVVLSLGRVVCGRHDGRAAVLRAIHESRTPVTLTRSADSLVGAAIQCRFNAAFERLLDRLRPCWSARVLRRPGTDAGRLRGRVSWRRLLLFPLLGLSPSSREPMPASS